MSSVGAGEERRPRRVEAEADLMDSAVAGAERQQVS
jgi:hypothetical protein